MAICVGLPPVALGYMTSPMNCLWFTFNPALYPAYTRKSHPLRVPSNEAAQKQCICIQVVESNAFPWEVPWEIPWVPSPVGSPVVIPIEYRGIYLGILVWRPQFRRDLFWGGKGSRGFPLIFTRIPRDTVRTRGSLRFPQVPV